MATAVYSMCALASLACAALLFWVYWQHRDRATRLVLWSGISFVWFAVSNTLVFADLVVFRGAELGIARAATACIGSACLLLGLIWETE